MEKTRRVTVGNKCFPLIISRRDLACQQKNPLFGGLVPCLVQLIAGVGGVVPVGARVTLEVDPCPVVRFAWTGQR
jgi:hypothetical protein